MDKQDEERVRQIAREEALKCIQAEELRKQQEYFAFSLGGIFRSNNAESAHSKPKIRVKKY